MFSQVALGCCLFDEVSSIILPVVDSVDDPVSQVKGVFSHYAFARTIAGKGNSRTDRARRRLRLARR